VGQQGKGRALEQRNERIFFLKQPNKMGKMGKRYLVFDGRTMPVLKKKEQQTTTTKEEGTGQAKEGSAKEGSAVDKSDTGGHGGGHDEVWAVATGNIF
jgi:hypothetical protein